MNRSAAARRGALALLLLVSLGPAAARETALEATGEATGEATREAARAADEPAGEVSDPALERARRILADTPLVDTHNDLPWVIREKLDGGGLRHLGQSALGHRHPATP